jgi:hypothetical protein
MELGQQPAEEPALEAAEEGKGAAPNGDGYRTKHQHGWRRIVRNFTPSWFVVRRWLEHVTHFLDPLS